MNARPNAWHSATSRLILIYGALFALWGFVLVGVIQWETTRYLNNVIDQMLVQRMHYIASTEPERMAATVDATSKIDPHGVMSVGLFDREHRPVAGNIDNLPRSLPRDGQVHQLKHGLPRPDRDAERVRARGLASVLPNGDILVIAKDTSTIDGIGAIIKRALLWGVSLTIIPGLFGGFLLRRGPEKRIRALQEATDPIRQGDLSKRLPVSRRGDELDQLAAIVNTMLGEIERLMNEVKGVCDNIAHDLRTPLTRLRARLYRTQQQLEGQPEEALVESCMVDIDAVLVRFRALLRVSELEDRNRAACFEEVDVGQVLRQVHEFYAPVAEDRGQPFDLDVQTLAPVRADAHLLFEALANLVGNAIKFTPHGGRVSLRASMDKRGPRVDIVDSGPGIPTDERDAVTRRFYRGDNSRTTAGSGLGLSIVSAIVRLHGYALDIGESSQGARLTLYCYALAPGEKPDTCLSRTVPEVTPAIV
ncbi:MAG TPA: HAMP domain-containing sensor histidine kinase [Dyella sp.]|uniref:sensor histidine kinase n=1 Tax=Dyella sp. TaxID=1869338 RepID=UPI002D799416|nr:HAMP domain-containing sensor histidine kinase [Dyella sp.]HET6553896.1 HAMP domain-containing sensor histidine kinase [Dyella sp.]